VNLRRPILLGVSHSVALAVGFAAGIYALPILIAPEAPPAVDLQAAVAQATYSAKFTRELKDSDAFHWGEGTVSIGGGKVTLVGKLAPGPDYKLYFSPEFVETEADFDRVKPHMARAGDIKTFENFIVPIPADIDPSKYVAVIVWCESFGQFITAAKYR
jgi:hypothetical protein